MSYRAKLIALNGTKKAKVKPIASISVLLVRLSLNSFLMYGYARDKPLGINESKIINRPRIDSNVVDVPFGSASLSAIWFDNLY